MIFALPYPPTANTYWRVWRGRAVKSTEAREYQRKVQLVAKASLGRDARPLRGPVRVEVSVYRPAKRGDLDNTLKVILDALRGIAYGDDAQIVALSARRNDDAKNPRAIVTVEAEPEARVETLIAEELERLKVAHE